MSEKVVLPKFDLPGKQMHPAVKLLWTVGGLLLLSMVALGGALWRNHAKEVAEENRKQAEIAAKTAEANAEAERARARQKELDTQVALAKVKAQEAAAKKNAPAEAKVATTAGRKHSGHHGSKSGAKTAVAKAGTDDGKKTTGKSTKKGDDVVDKLLASFK
jgi:hypothetical protein